MKLKEKLLEYCEKYNAPADENLDDYEKVLHSTVYKDAYLAKYGAFKNFLSQKVPDDKLEKFLKGNIDKDSYNNLVNVAKRENVSVFSAYSYYSLFDRINRDELERQKEPNKEPEKDEKSYIDQLCELLPEEYHEEAVQLIENTLDPYYWENDKLDTPSLSKEINEIKAELPPQDAEKYKDILDYAEKVTFKHKQYDFQSTLATGANNAAERVQHTKANAITLEKYGDVIKYSGLTASLKDDNNNPKLQELSKEKGRLSDGYKASLKKAFNIFADIEKDTGIDARAGEQGEKIYGFIGYTEARKKLFDAVRSKNIAEIEKCVTQHQKESLRLEELSRITEELDPSNTAFVGNIDISRNSSIPMKYIKNMPMSSKINTMFMLYSAMKESGLSIDEYLDSPGKAIEDIINKDINENVDLNLMVRGDDNVNKSISEVLKQFNGKSDSLGPEDMNRPLFNYGIGRSINAMHVLEPDAERKKDMIYASTRFEIKLSVAGACDNRNRTLFISEKTGAQKAAECSDLLANYFLFDDSTRDYNLLNAKSGYTDPMTFKYVPPFDRQKYIKDHAIDIA
ncbi:MAG: hypothetical protein KBS59_06815, partial [Clostridiales bacterium]|nr:hypothetical protein [Clostridiales bacterium]